MKLTECTALPDSVLENLRDGCLFYPCAGNDVLVPVELFSPFITDFVFVDKAYFDPNDQDGRYWQFGIPVKKSIPALGRHPAYALIEVKIWRSRLEDPEYRAHLGPCQRTEIYTHLPSGRVIRVHRIRDAGFRAFTRMPIKFQVFFYRGDSEGEGGSGNHWLSERWFDAVLSRMTDQGLVVTDGSNTGFQHSRYEALGRQHKYGCRSMDSQTGHRLDWIQGVDKIRTTQAWMVRDFFRDEMEPIRSCILSRTHDQARDSMTARNLRLPLQEYTVPIRLGQVVALKPSVIDASEQGNPIAQAKRAAYLLSRSEQDSIRIEKAWIWLENSATQGCEMAMRSLAFILEEGLAGQAADPVRALPYWAALAETGDIWAGSHCAWLLERGHIPETGELSVLGHFQERILGWSRQAAEQEYAPAILNMARYCKDGFASQPRDLRQALRWYRHWALRSSKKDPRGYFQVLKAIESEGNWDDICQLSDFYRDGTGCAQDIQAARSCYQKAADNGISEGLMSLGKLLAAHGDAEDENDRKWLEAAARAGSNSARLALVAWYGALVNNVPLDEMEAQQRLQRYPDRASLVYCAALLVRQSTTLLLDKKQTPWFSSAGQNGYFQVLKLIASEDILESLCQLGDCYRDGTGCAQDIQAARSCYQKAADNGISEGLMSLGKLLAAHGDAEDENDRKWLKAAARAGSNSARLALVAWYGAWVNDAPRDEIALHHWLQGVDEQTSLIHCAELLVRHATATPLDEDRFMRAWQACDRLKRQSPSNARRCRRQLIDFLVHTPSTDVPAGLITLFLHLAQSGPFRKEANIAYSLAQLWDRGSLAADAKQAAYWYRRAANRGHVEAQLMMARIYATGTGVTADPDAARGWKNLAKKTINL